jgi:hypothetical protein
MENVIDFSVADGGSILKVATGEAVHLSGDEMKANYYLWQFNPATLEKRLLARHSDTAASEAEDSGYWLHAPLPGRQSKQFFLLSPTGQAQIVLRLRRETEGYFYDFLAPEDEARLLLATELYKTHADYRWQPEVVWLTDSSFLTLVFKSHADPLFPQSRGVFAIAQVDLNAGAAVFLYGNDAIQAFPQFSLNAAGTVLYFLQKRGDITQLCRMDLLQNRVTEVYTVAGDIAQIRISDDDRRVIFTQITQTDIDIVRLDMIAGQLQLAAN